MEFGVLTERRQSSSVSRLNVVMVQTGHEMQENCWDISVKPQFGIYMYVRTSMYIHVLGKFNDG